MSGDVTSDTLDRVLRDFKDEVKEDLREFREALKDGLADVRKQILELPAVRADVYEAHRVADEMVRVSMEREIHDRAHESGLEELRDRIKALENFQTWLLRGITGTVVFGLVGAAIQLSH